MIMAAWRQFGHTTKVTMLENQRQMGFMWYITVGKMNKLDQSWFSVAVNIEWDIR